MVIVGLNLRPAVQVRCILEALWSYVPDVEGSDPVVPFSQCALSQSLSNLRKAMSRDRRSDRVGTMEAALSAMGDVATIQVRSQFLGSSRKVGYILLATPFNISCISSTYIISCHCTSDSLGSACSTISYHRHQALLAYHSLRTLTFNDALAPPAYRPGHPAPNHASNPHRPQRSRSTTRDLIHRSATFSRLVIPPRQPTMGTRPHPSARTV